MTSTTTANSALGILLEGSLEYDEILRLRRELYSNIRIREEVANAVSNLEKKSSDGQARLRQGVAYWLLGLCEEGAAVLSRETSRGNGALYYALCLLDRRKPADALVALEHALSKKPDSFELAILLVRAQREVGNTTTAEKILMDLEAAHQDRADYHYEKGACLDARGLYEEAMDEYEKAVTLDPDHARALFSLGLACDIRGSEEKALEYYERCRQLNPTFTNAIINLGLLCEDTFDYRRAIKCYREVLDVQPNHPRAQLYLKDAVASLNMYYDEEKAKQRDKRLQILNTPVTDFELSVRSRNCLNKMHIRTLGDLVKKTEQSLLNFKNFGETSLREIKNMLKQKSLHLGMTVEVEGEFPALPAVAEPAADEEVLNTTIAQLELNTRAKKAMENMNVSSVRDLVEKSEQELLACKNFGQTSLDEVKNKLAAMGLKLKEKP